MGIREKATTAKPNKLAFQDGRLRVGDMHFPDLALGEDEENPEVVVEIKYRTARRASFYDRCKKDIDKLRRLHDGRIHYFVVFDANPDYIFFDEHQRAELRAMSSAQCKLLHFPLILNTSSRKHVAREAIIKMREAGVDFVEQGKKNAAKAIKGAGSK